MKYFIFVFLLFCILAVSNSSASSYCNQYFREVTIVPNKSVYMNNLWQIHKNEQNSQLIEYMEAIGVQVVNKVFVRIEDNDYARNAVGRGFAYSEFKPQRRIYSNDGILKVIEDETSVSLEDRGGISAFYESFSSDQSFTIMTYTTPGARGGGYAKQHGQPTYFPTDDFLSLLGIAFKHFGASKSKVIHSIETQFDFSVSINMTLADPKSVAGFIRDLVVFASTGRASMPSKNEPGYEFIESLISYRDMANKK